MSQEEHPHLDSGASQKNLDSNDLAAAIQNAALNGKFSEAEALREQLMKTDYWSAFGYIAAEADLHRMR